MALVSTPIPGEPTQKTTGSISAWLWAPVAIGLIGAALFLPVAQSSDATTTGYAIQKHQQELTDLQAKNYALQAEIAKLGSMDRIRSEAARLGMVTPTPGGETIVKVNVPAPDAPLLPRSYAQRPSDTANPAGTPAPAQHGVLWHILHALSLR